MIKLTIDAELPDAETLELFLGSIHLFDHRNPGCRFLMMAMTEESDIADVMERLNRLGVKILGGGEVPKRKQ